MKNKVADGHAAEWQQLYEAAVLELDPARLRSRIEEARDAIMHGLEAADPANPAQNEALTNALQVLQDLTRISGEDGKSDVA